LVEGVYELLEEEVKDTPVHAGPWMRLWARLFDLALTKILLFTFFGVVLYPLLFNWGMTYRIIFNGIVVTGLYTLVEPYLLFKWGGTPGKYLLRIMIVNKKDKPPITFDEYRHRAYQVWYRGLAFGLSPIYLYTAFASYMDLKNKGATIWDEEGGFECLQGKLDDGRGLLALLLFLFVFYSAFSLP
jgi:hypothetical protein